MSPPPFPLKSSSCCTWLPCYLTVLLNFLVTVFPVDLIKLECDMKGGSMCNSLSAAGSPVTRHSTVFDTIPNHLIGPVSGCESIILWRCQYLGGIVSDGRTPDEWFIGKDLGGNSLGLIWVLSWHIPGETEENHANPTQDSQCPGRGLNLLNINADHSDANTW